MSLDPRPQAIPPSHDPDVDLFDAVLKLAIFCLITLTVVHSAHLLWIAHVLRNVGAG
ncbi:hypothetical protein TG4357_03720 [Thalassovita gelatinovora]|uniref:Uncharacterized protein n=1 Tax=Thalassovita gelatinovora TaxID=53501 RepID=A0A0P1G5S1_THAGE|nr:hypothetical protein [Thalassovita gelatinovora]QIZ79054.1 hypothetical protein HFZ77_00475 [Thalassovita gelatinovora]CUH68654.1 hypothetical protein TG4357_03720 [Thalassovita gelatinovora]SEQ56154.1 hypothetical protein SAMN04488043_106181 [Thalassovita gelatinovora]